MQDRTLNSITRLLERTVVMTALAALLYRATVYHSIEKAPGAAWGAGDVIDFALGLSVFLLGGLAAAAGVALSIRATDRDKGAAYRPAVIGMTTFVVYYLVHPYVPALL